MACDLKTVKLAFNDAVNSFRKAFVSSGGKAVDESLRFAIAETKSKYPDIDFDHESLTNPIIASLKKKGIVPENYEFGTKAAKNRRKNTAAIKELADKISKEEFKPKTEPKPSEFNEEEQKIKSFILSKYGKNLDKKGFDALLKEEVNGTSVKEIIDAQMAEEKAQKEAEKKVKEEQKQIENKAKQELRDKELADKISKEEMNKAEVQVTRKIESAAKKMDNLTENQKKDLARELINAFYEDGILDDKRVKDIYAKVSGKPHMTPELNNLIDKIGDDNKEVDRIKGEINAAQKDIASNPNKYNTPEKQAEAIANAKRLGTALYKASAVARKNAKNLSFALEKKGYWISDFADYIPLGMMSGITFIKNATGAIPDAVTRMAKGGTSALVNLMMKPFTKVNTNPFGARFMGGAKKYRNTLRETGEAFKEKQSSISSSSTPRQDYLNFAHSWRKAMDEHGIKKFISAAAAVLKINPDAASRILSGTDTITKSQGYNGELARIADSKGLKGAAKEFFLLNPDAESKSAAIDYALDITFEKELSIFGKKIPSSFDHRATAEKLIQKANKPGATMGQRAFKNPMLTHTATAIAKIIQGLNVPFIKIPTNLVAKGIRLANPEIAIFRGLIKSAIYKNESAQVRQSIITESLGEAAIGYYIRYVAIQMAAGALMSGGYDDEEMQAKDNVEKKLGGDNRINYNAFLRTALLGKKAEWKDGDGSISFGFLGSVGLGLGGYAHAFNNMSSEELKEYSDSWTSIFQPSIAAKSAVGSIRTLLDFPFLTGPNNVIKALTDKNGDKASKLEINWASALGGGILPATYQKTSMANTPEVVSRYDKEKNFLDNLTTELGYKFAFQNKDLKKKYFSLASEEEGAVKTHKSMFFDNLFGRALYANFSLDVHRSETGTPDDKLYNAMKEVPYDQRGELFPNAIEPRIEVSKYDSKKGVTVKKSVELTDEQYEYLQEKASMIRLLQATPYIMHPDFDKSSYSTKATKLQKIYVDGLKMAKELTLKQYPEIKKQEEADSKGKIMKSEIDKKVIDKEYK